MRDIFLFCLVAPVAYFSSTAQAAIRGGDILVTEHTGSLIGVDPATGNRTVLSGPGVGVGQSFGQLAGVAIAGDGAVLVVDEINDAVFRVDPATGNRSVLSSALLGFGSGPSMSRPFGIAIDSAENIYVSDFGSDAVFRIDNLTGNRVIVSGSLVGTGPALVMPLALTNDNAGSLFLADDGIIRIDLMTGDRQVVSSVTAGNGPNIASGNEGIAYGIADGLIYVSATESPAGIGIFAINQLTGDRMLVSGSDGITTRGTGPDFSSPRGIDFDESGNIIAVDIGLDAVIRIDPSTGNRTIVSSSAIGTGQHFNIPIGVAVVPLVHAVPEPASNVLWFSVLAFGLRLGRNRARESRPSGGTR